jgi:hypothetical protein
MPMAGANIRLCTVEVGRTTSCELALQINPSLATSLNGKGTALNMLHRDKGALEAFDLALKPHNDTFSIPKRIEVPATLHFLPPMLPNSLLTGGVLLPFRNWKSW